MSDLFEYEEQHMPGREKLERIQEGLDGISQFLASCPKTPEEAKRLSKLKNVAANWA